MVHMILNLKKTSHHSSLEVLCIPTCIKNILDNQFSHVKVSRSVLNKWCCFDGKLQDILGFDALEEHFAPKLLKNHKIKYFEKRPGKITDLTTNLKANIFSVIIFRLEDYNNWKKNSSIEVEKAGSTNYHALIVCGVDSSKELIYVYDPIFDKYKQYKESDPLKLYDQLSYLDFTRYWDKGFDSFMFWFEESQQTKKGKEQHKTLDKF